MDEIKGLKVRAPTRIGTKFLTAIGAVPVQMPVPQVTESLSKGVIDGAMVPWEVAPALKLQEVTKYHLDTAPGVPKMSNSIFVIAMNPAKYDSLPPDLKKVIDANTGLEFSKQIGKIFDGTTGGAARSSRGRRRRLRHADAGRVRQVGQGDRVGRQGVDRRGRREGRQWCRAARGRKAR